MCREISYLVATGWLSVDFLTTPIVEVDDTGWKTLALHTSLNQTLSAGQLTNFTWSERRKRNILGQPPWSVPEVRICKNSVAAFVWGWHSIDEFGQDRGACSGHFSGGEVAWELSEELERLEWADSKSISALDWSNRLTLNLYCKLALSNPFSEWFRSGSVQSDGGQRGPYYIIWHTYGNLQSTICLKLHTSFSSALGFR